jgi:hypothetical protein
MNGLRECAAVAHLPVIVARKMDTPNAGGGTCHVHCQTALSNGRGRFDRRIRHWKSAQFDALRALENVMERIEAMGPHQVHEYEIGGVVDAAPSTKRA